MLGRCLLLYKRSGWMREGDFGLYGWGFGIDGATGSRGTNERLGNRKHCGTRIGLALEAER